MQQPHGALTPAKHPAAVGGLASQLNLNARRLQDSAGEQPAQTLQRAAFGRRARRASNLQVNDPRVGPKSSYPHSAPLTTPNPCRRRWTAGKSGAKLSGPAVPGAGGAGPACAPLRRPAARPTPSRGAEAWRSRPLRSGFAPRCRGRSQSAPAAHGKVPGQRARPHSKDSASELLSIRLPVGHPPSPLSSSRSLSSLGEGG